MSTIPIVTLSNGAKVPAVGLGTYSSSTEGAAEAVAKGIELGYRHIDAAWAYPTQRAVGEGIAASKIPREELFITTKVWNTHHRPDLATASVNKSLEQLKTDYVDLVLIHWPATLAPRPVADDPANELKFPVEDGKLVVIKDHDIMETYRALEALVDAGKVKALGLSNFTPKLIEPILKACKHRPVADQVECHLWFQRKELAEYCKKEGILLTAYAPLGFIGQSKCPATKEDMDVVQRIADKHSCKEISQVSISWLTQRGICAIPKSFNPGRMATNKQLVKLDDDDMEALASLDKGMAGRQHGGIDFKAAVGEAATPEITAWIDAVMFD